MSGKFARRKGARGEYEVCQLIQVIVDTVYGDACIPEDLWPKIKRNVDQVRDGGYDIVGLPWAAIEVKYREMVQVEQWWEQTKMQARGLEPVLFWRSNGLAWHVRMNAWLMTPQGGTAIKCAADISIVSFEMYLKLRLTKELHESAKSF